MLSNGVVVSAGLAGLAGLLYVPQVGIITPAQIGVLPSLEMVIWVAVGGRGTLVGAIIGVRTNGMLMIVNDTPRSANSAAAQRVHASSAAFDANRPVGRTSPGADARFDRSVIPVRDVVGAVVLDRDEHLRPDTTLESLAALKPSFVEMGTKYGFDAVALQRYPEVERIEHELVDLLLDSLEDHGLLGLCHDLELSGRVALG